MSQFDDSGVSSNGGNLRPLVAEVQRTGLGSVVGVGRGVSHDREPFPRRSRMVANSLSGSGEGPGASQRPGLLDMRPAMGCR
jgi:hypothetical protein